MAKAWLSKRTLNSPASTSGQERQNVNLLTIPLETRLHVYEHILTDIQNERQQWDRRPTTCYDGLRLVCRDLHLETSEAIFSNFITINRISVLMNMSVTKTNFLKMRALHVEVDLDYDEHFFRRFGATLGRFQLSLQELHIFFLGHDSNGIEVNSKSCGMRLGCHVPESLPILPEFGQGIEKKLILLQQIGVLRKLRILQIRNANIPLLQSAVMADKPYLCALSVTCDPRSQSHNFRSWRSQRRDLFKGLLIPFRVLPPIHALQLDANAVTPIEASVNRVAPTLRHFSWRVPNLDFQEDYCDTPVLSFYSITERLIQVLSWRALNLETLRLCITIRNVPVRSGQYRRDIGSITSSMQRYLPQYSGLKHLEIHQDGRDEFFRNRLIDSLPYGLRRLYISDITISVNDLIAQLHKRYLQQNDIEDCSKYLYFHGIIDEECLDCCTSDHVLDISQTAQILVSTSGHVEYLPPACTLNSQASSERTFLVQRTLKIKNDYQDDQGMIGEDRLRTDAIPLNTGKLGFVTFEYDVTVLGDEDDRPDGLSCEDIESNTTKLLRVNGKLLDREHNLHLANTQAINAHYGIRPKEERDHRGGMLKEAERQEDESYSRWPNIHAALYNAGRFQREACYIKHIAENLEACFRARPHWYFGNEEEAEVVFRHEPAAKPEDQRQKPTIKDVPVSTTMNCEWMSPDPIVQPVGTFPRPVIPRDWKDQVE